MTAVSCFLSVTTVPAYETVLQLLENLQKHQTETYLLSKLNRRPSREPGSRHKFRAILLDAETVYELTSFTHVVPMNCCAIAITRGVPNERVIASRVMWP